MPPTSTFFHELNGDERERADEWLREYLRIIIRIAHSTASRSSDVPNADVDNPHGTGKVKTHGQ